MISRIFNTSQFQKFPEVLPKFLIILNYSKYVPGKKELLESAKEIGSMGK